MQFIAVPEIRLVLVLGFCTILVAAPVNQDPGAEGFVSIEAEDFDENNPGSDGSVWEFTTDASGFSGTGAMQALPDDGGSSPAPPEGPELVYQVNFVKTGPHYVWIRCTYPDLGADSVHAGLNGDGSTSDRIQPPKIADGQYYWGNDRRDNQGRAFVDVPSTGLHTIHIWMREDGFICDKIVLTTDEDYTPTGEGPPPSSRSVVVLAQNPSPTSNDELRDSVILSWTSGELAVTANVYLGTVMDDVMNADVANPLGVTVYEGVDTNSLTLGRLAFDTTYYWRVDGVNDAEPNSPWKGELWQFGVESETIPIPSVTANASSQVDEKQGAENTVNGTGLTDGFHDTDQTQMWLSSIDEMNEPSIVFTFDKVYKLHHARVWNHNSQSEKTVGYGIKDAFIETSRDGDIWTALKTEQIAQASTTDDYVGVDIPLDNVLAQHVRITAKSNWNQIPGWDQRQVGLSEIRFEAIPLYAREPDPVMGATDVKVRALLGWRAGREATQHEVRLGEDPDALAVLDFVDVPSYEATLDLDELYYWQIVGVNDVETPSRWEGDLWSFATVDHITVENFNGYSDDWGNIIFQSWIDGLGWEDPNGNSVPGNDSGALVGYWPPPTLEKTLARSGNSMPLSFDNSQASFSEAVHTFANPQDWTKHSVHVLSLHFLRGADNTGDGQIYVKVNDAKKLYQAPTDLPPGWEGNWIQWTIDLSTVNTDLTQVKSLTVGVEGSAATGTLYVEDIELYRSMPAMEQVVTWFEAESGTLGATMGLFEDTDGLLGASGGKYIGTEDGSGQEIGVVQMDGLASYTFSVSQAGVYKLLFRGGDFGGNSFYIRVSDAEINTTGNGANPGWVLCNSISPKDALGWSPVTDDNDGDKVVEYTLTAGDHTLDISRREDGTYLDAIAIVSVPK